VGGVVFYLEGGEPGHGKKAPELLRNFPFFPILFIRANTGNLPAPPCLGEVLRQVTLTKILAFFSSRRNLLRIISQEPNKFRTNIPPGFPRGDYFTKSDNFVEKFYLIQYHFPAPTRFFLTEASEILCTYDRVPACVRFCPLRFTA
jgi:hypothetical protein